MPSAQKTFVNLLTFQHINLTCLFECNSLNSSKFDRICDKILNIFLKKWHPPSARMEYQATFSTAKWNTLMRINPNIPCQVAKHATMNIRVFKNCFQQSQYLYYLLSPYLTNRIHLEKLKNWPKGYRNWHAVGRSVWTLVYEHATPKYHSHEEKKKRERKKEEWARKRKLVEYINQQQAKIQQWTFLQKQSYYQVTTGSD